MAFATAGANSISVSERILNGNIRFKNNISRIRQDIRWEYPGADDFKMLF